MTVDGLLNGIIREIINPLILLMFGVAILVFLYGGFELISSGENSEKKDSGKRNLFWGIVGLFIMTGVYGIIQLVLGTFNIPIPS